VAGWQRPDLPHRRAVICPPSAFVVADRRKVLLGGGGFHGGPCVICILCDKSDSVLC
jgi:hypothetical protein